MTLDEIREVQNFNRSIMTKTSYTRSDIEYIERIYFICAQSRSNHPAKDLFNNRYEMIVTLAQKQIDNFSKGNIHLSPNAYQSMEKFINTFGKEYTRSSTGTRTNMVYEFTPSARRAKIMLKKLSNRHTLNIEKTANRTQPNTVKTITIQNPKTVKRVLRHKPLPKVQKEAVSAKIKKQTKTSFNIKKYLTATSLEKIKVQSEVKKHIHKGQEKIKTLTPVITHQMEVIGQNATEVTKIVGEGVSNIVRRYGVAIAALWGMCGAGNMNNIGAKASFGNTIKSKIEQHIKQAQNSQKAQEKTKITTPNDFKIVYTNLNEYINSDAEDTIKRPQLTVADMSYKDYYFSKEDLQALQVSEQGASLAEHAQKVVRNMNYPGYCYRGVKRMFNRANLGAMHGGSAYMAKKYLDNNPNFVRINCDVADLKYLPKGTVVVFGKGKNGVRPHGHIGVLDEINGKMVDRSSKTYNVRETLGGYSSVDVYIHADTPLPQSVQDKINKIMVLDNTPKNPEPKEYKLTFAHFLKQHNENMHS